jgi:microcompartment protein CcmL/EutN
MSGSCRTSIRRSFMQAAAVDLTGLHLADDLGGKAYLVVEGSIGDVEAAVESAADRAGAQLVNRVVIPLLTDDLRDDLAASDRFLDRLSGVERGAS